MPVQQPGGVGVAPSPATLLERASLEVERRRHKREPWGEQVVQFCLTPFGPAPARAPGAARGLQGRAAAPLSEVQRDAAGSGSEGEGGAARGEVEEATTHVQLRTELLKGMKAALVKQAAEAVKGLQRQEAEAAPAAGRRRAGRDRAAPPPAEEKEEEEEGEEEDPGAAGGPPEAAAFYRDGPAAALAAVLDGGAPPPPPDPAAVLALLAGLPAFAEGSTLCLDLATNQAPPPLADVMADLFGGSDDGEGSEAGGPSQGLSGAAEGAAGALEEVRRHLAALMARGALPPPWLDPIAHAHTVLPGLPPYIHRAAAPQQAQQRGQGGGAPGLAALGARCGWASLAGPQQQQQQAAAAAVQQAQRGLFQPSAAWDAIEEDSSEMDIGDASVPAAGDAWELGGGAGDDWDDAPDFMEAYELAEQEALQRAQRAQQAQRQEQPQEEAEEEHGSLSADGPLQPAPLQPRIPVFRSRPRPAALDPEAAAEGAPHGIPGIDPDDDPIQSDGTDDEAAARGASAAGPSGLAGGGAALPPRIVPQFRRHARLTLTAMAAASTARDEAAAEGDAGGGSGDDASGVEAPASGEGLTRPEAVAAAAAGRAPAGPAFALDFDPGVVESLRPSILLAARRGAKPKWRPVFDPEALCIPAPRRSAPAPPGPRPSQAPPSPPAPAWGQGEGAHAWQEQGTAYQGTDHQGIAYQGTALQGTAYQGEGTAGMEGAEGDDPWGLAGLTGSQMADWDYGSDMGDGGDGGWDGQAAAAAGAPQAASAQLSAGHREAGGGQVGGQRRAAAPAVPHQASGWAGGGGGDGTDRPQQHQQRQHQEQQQQQQQRRRQWQQQAEEGGPALDLWFDDSGPEEGEEEGSAAGERAAESRGWSHAGAPPQAQWGQHNAAAEAAAPQLWFAGGGGTPAGGPAAPAAPRTAAAGRWQPADRAAPLSGGDGTACDVVWDDGDDAEHAEEGAFGGGGGGGGPAALGARLPVPHPESGEVTMVWEDGLLDDADEASAEASGGGGGGRTDSGQDPRRKPQKHEAAAAAVGEGPAAFLPSGARALLPAGFECELVFEDPDHDDGEGQAGSAADEGGFGSPLPAGPRAAASAAAAAQALAAVQAAQERLGAGIIQQQSMLEAERRGRLDLQPLLAGVAAGVAAGLSAPGAASTSLAAVAERCRQGAGGSSAHACSAQRALLALLTLATKHNAIWSGRGGGGRDGGPVQAGRVEGPLAALPGPLDLREAEAGSAGGATDIRISCIS